MKLDDIQTVEDVSEITIRSMIDRLRRSTTSEQFIYRETELDEMWRIVDLALKDPARTADADSLSKLREAIVTAHDLVGVDLRPKDAAAALEAILSVVARLR